MSDVLRARLRACLEDYGVTPPPNLDLDDLAAELLGAVLPAPDDQGDTPILWQLARRPGICMNCLCTDCGCCVGCGQPDADLIGSHGYWCAL